MAELKAQKALAEPSEIFFVADAMTGQDALVSASAFQSQIGITGIVLTKLDGDATTDRFVTDIARMQQIALRVGLPGGAN